MDEPVSFVEFLALCCHTTTARIMVVTFLTCMVIAHIMQWVRNKNAKCKRKIEEVWEYRVARYLQEFDFERRMWEVERRSLLRQIDELQAFLRAPVTMDELKKIASEGLPQSSIPSNIKFTQEGGFTNES